MPGTRRTGLIFDNGQGRFEWHANMRFETFFQSLHTNTTSPKFLFAGVRRELMSGMSTKGELYLWVMNLELLPQRLLSATLGIRTNGNFGAETSGKGSSHGDYSMHWGMLLVELLSRWEEVKGELLIVYCQLHPCDISAISPSPSNMPAGSGARSELENQEIDCKKTYSLLSKRMRVDSEKADKESKAEEENSRIFKNLLSLSNNLKDLFVNGEGTDVTLIVMGQEFRVHSALLRARSTVFSSMMTHDMLEKNSGVVKIEDCKPGAFHELLYFLYTGKMEGLTEDNVLQLYYAADKYEMVALKLECVEFIRRSLSPEVVCGVITLAKLHSEPELLSWGTDYFVKNAEKVLETTEWQNYLIEYPTEANELYIKALKTIRK